MTLNEEQKQKVIGWIKEGRKLSEIQNLIDAEFGMRMTYMEVRFLVDDLKVMPIDNDSEKSTEKKQPQVKPKDDKAETKKDDEVEVLSEVSVTIDKMTKPGAVMSGNVRFSDGVTAEWYVDEMGRLGLVASKPGYRPSEQDVKKFQVELQKQLSGLGYI